MTITRRFCGPLILGSLLGGSVMALIGQGLPLATAEVRPTAPREAFKSGGERSEVALREILDVLKQMDRRVERIEAAVAKKK
jgi:hypothetical protein